ncbi:hypothetical protein N499_0670B, partial [Wolbachia pipientis wVitA]
IDCSDSLYDIRASYISCNVFEMFFSIC